MSVILGAIMGTFIGLSLYALVAVTKINELEDKAFYYKKKFMDERFKVQQRDCLIRDYQKDQVILLENAKEQRDKKRVSYRRPI